MKMAISTSLLLSCLKNPRVFVHYYAFLFYNDPMTFLHHKNNIITSHSVYPVLVPNSQSKYVTYGEASVISFKISSPSSSSYLQAKATSNPSEPGSHTSASREVEPGRDQ